MTLRFLLFVIGLLNSVPAFAVLGGQHPQGLHPEIFQIDARMGDQSRVCTATAISPTVLLTAAHCFDHIQDHNKSDFQLFVNGKLQALAFQLQRHPNYSERKKFPNYLRRSNFDVAVLRFPKARFATYKSIQLKPQLPKGAGQFFGTGMRQLHWSESDGISESQRGELQEAVMPLVETTEGIISSKPSLLNLNSTGNRATILGSGQILRSDSGGPLLVAGRIVGIARNYQLKSLAYDQRDSGTKLRHESHFTNLSHKMVSKFLANYVP